VGNLDPEQRRFISIAVTDLLICMSIVLVILCQSAQNRRLDAMVERAETLHVRLKNAAESSHTNHMKIRSDVARIKESTDRIERATVPKESPAR